MSGITIVPGEEYRRQLHSITHITCSQDVVDGLDGIMFADLMGAIEWFFNVHDKDKDGSLTKDEVLQLSESLLVKPTI